MTLGDLIDRTLLAHDQRDIEMRGKVSCGNDLRSDLRGIWSPLQAKAQLGQALAMQRRRWQARWGEREAAK